MLKDAGKHSAVIWE